jgi:hypothetical protein
LTRRRRQLRLLAPAALLLVAIPLGALIANAMSGPGSSSPPSGGATASRPRTRRSTGSPRPVAVRLLVRRTGTLPAALEDAAAASLGQGRVVLFGGLDAADTSTATITALAAGANDTGVRPGVYEPGAYESSTREPGAHDTGARLPEPQHDAQAAVLGGAVYVFGGGQVESYDHILRFDPSSGRVSVVGHLPQPASDVAVAAIGSTVYIVGGYNGRSALDTILAWSPGTSPAVVGRLPTGLRYAAVAASGSQLIIAGGSTSTGASRAILRFEPSSGKVTDIGRLPAPLTHASAVTLGSWVFVIGGRGASPESQTAAILSIDPADGRVQRAGSLPVPLSDASVAAVGGGIVLAGGRSPTGTRASILELTPTG